MADVTTNLPDSNHFHDEIHAYASDNGYGGLSSSGMYCFRPFTKHTLGVGIGILPAVARNPAVTGMEIATLAALAPEARVMRMYHGVDFARFDPALRQVPDAEVVAIASARLSSAEAVAASFGVPHAYDDWQAMLGAHVVPVRDGRELRPVEGRRRVARRRCPPTRCSPPRRSRCG